MNFQVHKIFINQTSFFKYSSNFLCSSENIKWLLEKESNFISYSTSSIFDGKLEKEWHKISRRSNVYAHKNKYEIQNDEIFIRKCWSWSKKLLIWYYNRVAKRIFRSFYDIAGALFFCSEKYSKDINPTHDSPVSNHNKNQFSNLDIGSRYSKSIDKRGRGGTRKVLQFFNPLKYSGNKKAKGGRGKNIFVAESK